MVVIYLDDVVHLIDNVEKNIHLNSRKSISVMRLFFIINNTSPYDDNQVIMAIASCMKILCKYLIIYNIFIHYLTIL